jgi:hypothetical protein
VATLKIGLVTYTPERVEGYDPHVYYAKWVDGSVFPPAREMQNDITCFCDAKAIRENPTLVAISKNGLALRKNKKANLAFDFVCPTNPEYQAKVLDYVDELGKEKIQGVTLNLYHFPEEEFCVCPRCVELWRRSGLNWTEWRAQTITKFIGEAKRRVKGTFAVEMFPDPVLAKERFGIDFNQIAAYVDYFHVPLSARDYTTNYWVDLLTRDFIKTLRKPVVVELSAEMLTDEKSEALLKTMAYISRYNLEAILLLVHDAENARQVARYAVHNADFREWLKKYEFTEMNQIVDDWAKIY